MAFWCFWPPPVIITVLAAKETATPPIENRDGSLHIKREAHDANTKACEDVHVVRAVAHRWIMDLALCPPPVSGSGGPVMLGKSDAKGGPRDYGLKNMGCRCGRRAARACVCHSSPPDW